MSETDVDMRPATTYFDNVAAGRLSFQRCAECHAAVFYPRVACPSCGGVRLQWEDSAGAGTVYSVTSIPRREKDPVVVCLVDLDEGFRMMSTIAGEGGSQTRIGQRVRMSFDQVGEQARVVFIAEVTSD
jgi:uncharacterized OB-fold protein